MTAQQLAYYLIRIRNAQTPPELQDIADDAQKEHPGDEATSRIIAMAKLKAERIVRGN